jgi:hypothetical protein
MPRNKPWSFSSAISFVEIAWCLVSRKERKAND